MPKEYYEEKMHFYVLSFEFNLWEYGKSLFSKKKGTDCDHLTFCVCPTAVICEYYGNQVPALDFLPDLLKTLNIA